MAEAVIPRLIGILQEQQIFEIYLPFLLAFSIFYALLTKLNIFGEGSKKINVVVAGIAAAYIMIFSPIAGTIAQFFASFFAQTSIVLVTLLVFMMVIGLLTGPFWTEEKIGEIGRKVAPWAVAIGFLLVLGMFLQSGGLALFTRIAPPGFQLPISGEDLALIILVIFTILVMVWLASGEGEKKGRLELPFKIG